MHCRAVLLHAIRRARLGRAPLSRGLPDRVRTLRATNPRSNRKTRNKRAVKLEFENLVKFYECYFEFKSHGGEVDFYALCEKAGLNFAPVKSFYYE